MFALDLFNNDHERRLAEGAVDQLEQRRIDDLAMKMDDLVARAKQVKDPAHKAALVKEFQKCKAERDSYYKIKDECMGYGGIVGEAGIGQDIVNKTEKMARATPSTPTGKVASTVKNAAKWLAGKGGPGKEGPTYEGQDQKKNSEDPKLARLKVSARRAYPQAETDDEALTLYILNKEESDVDRLERENEREDRIIARLGDVEQNLQQQIDKLTSDDVAEGFQDFNKVEPYAVCLAGKPVKKFDYYEDARRFHDNWKKKLYNQGEQAKADKITLMPLGLDEAETDYSKRRKREKDIDAGRTVPKQRQSKITDYQKRRAQQKKEMELGEDSSTSSEDAERAILNRIMVAHLDLLKEFGPQKVMQAVEEVAYNVGDLDEIGTSDVSAWVNEVRRILGA